MLLKKICSLVIITFFLKLIAGLILPFAGDEAYYWFWGQHPQLSYFDHPGMVAWLSSLSNYIPLKPWHAVRFVFIITSTLTFFVWLKVFLLKRKTQNPEQLFSELNLFTAFYMLNPLLGLGSILVTPDSPLLLFWGLACYFVLKIISERRSLDYIFLGISLGLGFCSKYHIVLFPLVTFAGLYLEKNLRPVLNKKVLLTVMFGLLFSLPVLIWNYQNNFSSFKFQLSHGLEASQSYQVWWTTSYLLGQVLIFNPVLLFSMFYKMKKSFLSFSACGQWLFFLWSSFKAKVEANWPVTSHALALIEHDGTRKKIVRYSLFYYAVVWLSIPALLLTVEGQKKFNQLPTILTVKKIAPELENLRPLYGPTYQISSLLSLMNSALIYKLNGLSRYDFFDSLPESSPKESLFYVLKYTTTTWPNHYNRYIKTKIKEFPEFNLEVFEFRYE